jgi:hypothetical protein
MSQLDRQRARASALRARGELAQLIRTAPITVVLRTEMLDRLTELWLEADRACGGVECRP